MSAMSALPLRDDAAEPELLHWSSFGPPSDDFKVKQQPLPGLSGGFSCGLITFLPLLRSLLKFLRFAGPRRCGGRLLEPSGFSVELSAEFALSLLLALHARGVGSQVLMNCRERSMALLRNMTRLLASGIRS